MSAAMLEYIDSDDHLSVLFDSFEGATAGRPGSCRRHGHRMAGRPLRIQLPRQLHCNKRLAPRCDSPGARTGSKEAGSSTPSLAMQRRRGLSWHCASTVTSTSRSPVASTHSSISWFRAESSSSRTMTDGTDVLAPFTTSCRAVTGPGRSRRHRVVPRRFWSNLVSRTDDTPLPCLCDHSGFKVMRN